MEDQVANDWVQAVDWIHQLQADASCKIYAVVGPEDDYMGFC
jgi:hypothetical protein